jgi:transcriptional regulator with XRE-family HTH domain
MGLVDEPEDSTLVLDFALLRRVAQSAAETAGVGREYSLLLPHNSQQPARASFNLDHWLVRFQQALEESPYPPGEWRRAREQLEDDQLAELLAVSPSSVRRYASGERETPDETAWRLHTLTRILSALAGAYNERGMRRWFERPRAQLDGRSPGELFRSARGEDDPDLTRVVELAEALLGASAAA